MKAAARAPPTRPAADMKLLSRKYEERPVVRRHASQTIYRAIYHTSDIARTIYRESQQLLTSNFFITNAKSETYGDGVD